MQDYLHDKIDPPERISRYILIQRYFNPRTGHISPQAFKPTNPKKEGDFRKTSVYRTEGLMETEIWMIGDDYVTKLHPAHLPILARADIQAQKIISLDLKFDADSIPHPCHANVIGWPDDPEVRQMKALSLAQSSQLVPRRR